ncbi:MAG TPA: tetratricopeptide repeat protein [Nitrospiria bacterium]
MFIVITAILLVLIAAGLSYPLVKKATTPIPMGPDAARDQERIDLEIEKQTLFHSLSELDMESAQNRLTPDDYRRLKAVDEYRLGRLLEKMDAIQSGTPPAPVSKSKARPARSGIAVWLVPGALTTVVLGIAALLYSHLNGIIGMDAQMAAARRAASSPQGQGMPNPVEMVARLEKRLKENPNDLEGQIMAGRSYMTLQRMDDALKAWNKVVELDRGNHEAHYFLGYMLLQSGTRDDLERNEMALNHFETALVKVPRDPAVLWYKGVALLRLGRNGQADQSWTEAFQNLAPGTEDAEYVKKSLQDLRAGRPPAL